MTTTEPETSEAGTPDSGGGEGTPPALEAGEAEAVPFWQRPYVERYVVPLVMPLAVVTGIVLMVLNLSRIFLAGAGSVSVAIGSTITVLILLGAALLSAAAPRLRSSSIALVTVAFVATIMLGGWLSVGTAEEEGEEIGAFPPEGPALSELDFDGTTELRFVPDTVEVETGIHRITLTNVGSLPHTFVFETSGTEFPNLSVNTDGDTDTARAFLGEPQEYIFFCSVPGHREAGMEGVIRVTGDPKTFEEAQAELAGAAGEEGTEGEGTEGEGGEGEGAEAGA